MTDPKGKQHLLPPDASEEAMGAAVIDALAHSRQITGLELETLMWGRHGTGKERYEKWAGDLQQSFGYKSRTGLFKNMNLCHVKRRNDQLIFVPTVHAQLQAWESAKNDGVEVVAIPAGSNAQAVGAALKTVLSRCC